MRRVERHWRAGSGDDGRGPRAEGSRLKRRLGGGRGRESFKHIGESGLIKHGSSSVSCGHNGLVCLREDGYGVGCKNTKKNGCVSASGKGQWPRSRAGELKAGKL